MVIGTRPGLCFVIVPTNLLGWHNQDYWRNNNYNRGVFYWRKYAPFYLNQISLGYIYKEQNKCTLQLKWLQTIVSSNVITTKN